MHKLLLSLLLLVPSLCVAQSVPLGPVFSHAGGGNTVTVDSQGTGNSGSGVGSLTFSFTNTAGTFLVCGVNAGSSATATVSSVTYNGVAMTAAATETWDGGLDMTAIYYLASPATGAHNVVVTYGSTVDTAIAGCTSLTNVSGTPVAQTGVNKNDTTGSATASVALTGTSTGNLVFAQMGTGSGYSSTTNTLNWSDNVSGANAGGNAASTRQAGGGSVTMSDTVTSDFWGMVAVEFAHN